MGGDQKPDPNTRRSVIAGLTAGLLSAPSLVRAQTPPPAAASPQPVPESVLTAADDLSDRMTVPVTVNGLGPFSFVIDTGSNRTVISDVLAARLDLPMAEALHVHAATGVVQTGSVHVDSLMVGRRRMSNLRAPVLTRENLGALGMLGIDAVADQRVIMDFHRQEMRLSTSYRAEEDTGALVVSARSKYGQLLLVDASVEGIPLYVIVDTGGETTIGNLAMRKLLARRRQQEAKAVNVISVTGDTASADLTLLPELKLGQITVRNQQIAYADMYTFAQFGLQNKPSMLLGMSTLRHFAKVQIDFPRREVRFLLEG